MCTHDAIFVATGDTGVIDMMSSLLWLRYHSVYAATWALIQYKDVILPV